MFKLLEKNKFSVQSFTYFIPSPPLRSTGYREKQFDQLLSAYLAEGFDLLDIKTQAISKNDSAGMWVLCIVRPQNKTAANLNWDHFQDKFLNTISKTNQPVDGLYYIDSDTITEKPSQDEDFEYYDENKIYKKK